jgi:hypothetical protein
MKLPEFNATLSLGKAHGHYRTSGNYKRAVEAIQPAQLPPRICTSCSFRPVEGSIRCAKICFRPGFPSTTVLCPPEDCGCTCNRTITRCCDGSCTPVDEPVPCPF